MKFQITYKDPDGPFEGLQEALMKYRAGLPDSMTDEEKEAACDKRWEALLEAFHQWAGEYVTIEIDTNADTAVVVKAK